MTAGLAGQSETDAEVIGQSLAALRSGPGLRPSVAVRHRHQPGRLAPRRSWRLAAAALAAAVAAAAGFVTTQVIAPGGASPAGALTVRELAYRAAAARRQPAVSPGQWVYWQETRGRERSDIFEVWTTADSTRAAFVGDGKVQSFDFARQGYPQYIGQPEANPLSGGGYTASAATGTVPIAYARLGSLPRGPRALLRYLANLPLPHVHAVDAAGRPGVGFVSPALPGGGNQELIFNRRTYQLMGDEKLMGPGLQRQSGVAFLRVVLVSGPGVAPPGPAAGS